jgi:hypothetical protein
MAGLSVYQLPGVEAEEIDSLKSILYDLGFTEQAVSAALAA